MAYPPPTLATNRTNAVPQLNTHPADHNAVNLAVNDIVGKLNTVDAALTALTTLVGTHAAQITNLNNYVNNVGTIHIGQRSTTDAVSALTIGNAASVSIASAQAGYWFFLGIAQVAFLGASACDVDISLNGGGSGHTVTQSINGVAAVAQTWPVYLSATSPVTASTIIRPVDLGCEVRVGSIILGFRTHS